MTVGMFGEYGGQFVPETLVGPLTEVEAAFRAAQRDPEFQREKDALLRDFVGRRTPLTRTRRLYRERDITVWLKREDLAHTGAHKINNAVGQALLAHRMGKRRILADTGAGQHGVAVAAVCAYLGLDCTIFQGSVDAKRQEPNLQRMNLLGATVVQVDAGSATLKDALTEAIRDWLTHPDETYYLIGSTVGPHPFPTIVSEFQSVLGRESRAQMLDQAGVLPDAVVACVGGGSNSIGMFRAFLDEPVRLYGVQAAGDGSTGPGAHASPLLRGEPGVLHGTRTYLIQDEDGQIQPTHSIAPGLDYAGAGPEHSHLHDAGRVTYLPVTDDQALEAFAALSRDEGIIPALEPAHALGALPMVLPDLPDGAHVLVSLSGRGDKDLGSAMDALSDRTREV